MQTSPQENDGDSVLVVEDKSMQDFVISDEKIREKSVSILLETS
jgi:hypothetical protein